MSKALEPSRLANDVIFSASFFFSSKILIIVERVPAKTEVVLLWLLFIVYLFQRTYDEYSKLNERYQSSPNGLFKGTLSFGMSLIDFVKRSVSYLFVQYVVGLVQQTWEWRSGEIESVVNPLTMIISGFLVLHVLH